MPCRALHPAKLLIFLQLSSICIHSCRYISKGRLLWGQSFRWEMWGAKQQQTKQQIDFFIALLFCCGRVCRNLGGRVSPFPASRRKLVVPSPWSQRNCFLRWHTYAVCLVWFFGLVALHITFVPCSHTSC